MGYKKGVTVLVLLCLIHSVMAIQLGGEVAESPDAPVERDEPFNPEPLPVQDLPSVQCELEEGSCRCDCGVGERQIFGDRKGCAGPTAGGQAICGGRGQMCCAPSPTEQRDVTPEVTKQAIEEKEADAVDDVLAPGVGCEDLDDGINIFEQSLTRYQAGSNEEFLDSCESDTVLKEFYCQDNTIALAEITCDGKCTNGACTASYSLLQTDRDQVKLEFLDADGNLVRVPYIYANPVSWELHDDGLEVVDTHIKFGDNDDDLVFNETVKITRNDYFIVTKDGKASYALRYKSADRSQDDKPLLRFDNLGAGERIEIEYDPEADIIAYIELDNANYAVRAASPTDSHNFDLYIDFNGNGVFEEHHSQRIVEGGAFAKLSTRDHGNDFLTFKDSTFRQVSLAFTDAQGHISRLPLARARGDSIALLDGRQGDVLLEESQLIDKRNYFVLSYGGRSTVMYYEDWSYVREEGNNVYTFVDQGSDIREVITVHEDDGQGTLRVNGHEFIFQVAYKDEIFIDLNGDGKFTADTSFAEHIVPIYSENGNSFYVKRHDIGYQCEDFDFGKDEFFSSVAIQESRDGDITGIDACEGEDAVREFACLNGNDGNAMFQAFIECPYGCLNNQCRTNFRLIPIEHDAVKLEFFDASGNSVRIPFVHVTEFEWDENLDVAVGGTIEYGDHDDKLIFTEGQDIEKDDYFILTLPEGKSYAVRYRGGDKITRDDPILKFDTLGNAVRLEVPAGSPLEIDGNAFAIEVVGDSRNNDFAIQVDLNGDGVIDTSNVLIVESLDSTTLGMETEGFADFRFFRNESRNQMFVQYRNGFQGSLNTYVPITTIPIFYANDDEEWNLLKFGTSDGDFIYQEEPISRGDRFLVNTHTWGSFAFEYVSLAPPVGSNDWQITLKDLELDREVILPVDGGKATLTIFDFYHFDIVLNDRLRVNTDLMIDLNGDGIISGITIPIENPFDQYIYIEPPQLRDTCRERDRGINLFESSSIENQYGYIATDYCVDERGNNVPDSNRIIEYHCEESDSGLIPIASQFDCDCVWGECIQPFLLQNLRYDKETDLYTITVQNDGPKTYDLSDFQLFYDGDVHDIFVFNAWYTTARISGTLPGYTSIDLVFPSFHDERDRRTCDRYLHVGIIDRNQENEKDVRVFQEYIDVACIPASIQESAPFESEYAPLHISERFVRNTKSLGDVKSKFTGEDLEALSNTFVGSLQENSITQTIKFPFASNLEELSGIVSYSENDDDQALDYLFFHSGEEIANYTVEFERPFVSTKVLQDNGFFQYPGFLGRSLEMIGKRFMIVEAEGLATQNEWVQLTLLGDFRLLELGPRDVDTIMINGNEYEIEPELNSDGFSFIINGYNTGVIHKGESRTINARDFKAGIFVKEVYDDSVQFYVFESLLFLKDVNIADEDISHALETDDDKIDDAEVFIQGSADQTSISLKSISIKIYADNDFWVPRGTVLSSFMREPEGLFTQNWDIMYEGLSREDIEVIRIETRDDEMYVVLPDQEILIMADSEVRGRSILSDYGLLIQVQRERDFSNIGNITIYVPDTEQEHTKLILDIERYRGSYQIEQARDHQSLGFIHPSEEKGVARAYNAYGTRFDWRKRTLTSDSLVIYQPQNQLFPKVSLVVYETAQTQASDFNGDGEVEFSDFVAFAMNFGKSGGEDGFDPLYDLDGDGHVDFPDFLLFAQAFGGELEEMPEEGDMMEEIELGFEHFNELFTEDGVFTAEILVDEDAPAEHVMAARRLQEKFGDENTNVEIKLSQDATRTNWILIGGPCDNRLTKDMFHSNQVRQYPDFATTVDEGPFNCRLGQYQKSFGLYSQGSRSIVVIDSAYVLSDQLPNAVDYFIDNVDHNMEGLSVPIEPLELIIQPPSEITVGGLVVGIEDLTVFENLEIVDVISVGPSDEKIERYRHILPDYDYAGFSLKELNDPQHYTLISNNVDYEMQLLRFENEGGDSIYVTLERALDGNTYIRDFDSFTKVGSDVNDMYFKDDGRSRIFEWLAGIQGRVYNVRVNIPNTVEDLDGLVFTMGFATNVMPLQIIGGSPAPDQPLAVVSS